MHRSRLQSLVIDCDDLEAGIAFWTRALGTEVVGRDEPYVSLESPQPGLKLLLQSVCEPKTAKSRVHLDIETDDVEAESLRLESFGARTGRVEGGT
jgi:catechol 2,3-dioxygenase-like lactoylglutathione lyase family enzyme